MSDRKPARRELLRPVQLLAIAAVCGVFAGVIVFFTTGALDESVNTAIANGTATGLTPTALGLIAGGIGFIATLLILSILILAVDPKQYSTEEMNRPVLYDPETDDSDAGDKA